jgi:hypothetical protein
MKVYIEATKKQMIELVQKLLWLTKCEELPLINELDVETN